MRVQLISIRGAIVIADNDKEKIIQGTKNTIRNREKK